MDFPTFLKTHSSIPNDFIDKFLSFGDVDTDQPGFVIDANDVATYLGVRKSAIVKTLRESYVEDVHYKIEHAPSRKGKEGSNNYKRVAMTAECFKRLCMRTRSKRASEIHTYFIEIEGIFIKYLDFVREGIAAKRGK
jgi:phage anti-repressor protein